MLVFITGATSGIGKAAAQIFAKNGHHLILTGRRQQRLEELKALLTEQYKVDVTVLCFDIRNKKSTDEAVASLGNKAESIDILINNAGLASGLAPLQEGNVDDWEKMIDTNIKGLLYITRAISPFMVQKKAGHIINIGSIAGKEAYANGNVYCASKHAVDALNKGMRIDLVQHGVRVSSVNPGMVETEFSIVRFHGDEERAKKAYQGMTPLNAGDIAETIYWIASRPAHVNINEVIIMPSAQANATTVIRK